MHPWDESWPQLRRGDVYPLPLATDTHWTGDGWEVEVVMLTEVSPSGYGSVPIFTYREPYDPTLGPSAAEADRVTRECAGEFARRLAVLLADR